MNVFGPTDGAFETAQNAGLIPTDSDGELSKNCKKNAYHCNTCRKSLTSD